MKQFLFEVKVTELCQGSRDSYITYRLVSGKNEINAKCILIDSLQADFEICDYEESSIKCLNVE